MLNRQASCAAGDAETSGTCTLCGSHADGEMDECHRLRCNSRCTDNLIICHSACLAKWLRAGSFAVCKGKQGKIPDSGFQCVQPGCKGKVLHCNLLVVKKKKQAPPPVLQPPARAVVKQPQLPPPVPKKPAHKKPAGPVAANPAVPELRRPIAEEPKPDPLGRKLGGGDSDSSSSLPVGWDMIEQGRIKANSKNAKRAAKRREAAAAAAALEAGSAASGDGSLGSGLPGSDGGSGATMGRFITDIDRFNALLSSQLGDSSGSESESEPQALEPGAAAWPGHSWDAHGSSAGGWGSAAVPAAAQGGDPPQVQEAWPAAAAAQAAPAQTPAAAAGGFHSPPLAVPIAAPVLVALPAPVCVPVASPVPVAVPVPATPAVLSPPPLPAGPADADSDDLDEMLALLGVG